MIASFKNKTFLITGGYGFIGSHLARRLLNLQAKNCSFHKNTIKLLETKGYSKNILKPMK